MSEYRRSIVDTIVRRCREPRRFIQVVIGPRQTGKTTAVTRALEEAGTPYVYASADESEGTGSEWLRAQWEIARSHISGSGTSMILAIDEAQSISQWPKTVKALWDEDARARRDLRVLITGSSSLMLQSGLSESLTGRFELIHSPHWSLRECQDAFGYDLDEYLMYGGYPAAASLRGEQARWYAYMRDSIVEATLSRDVISLESVRKPAVLRALFLLGTQYSAQELSYRKMLGQLTDAGNTNTIAHYLQLLGNAGLLTGIQKYSPKLLASKASSPRLMVYDTSLMTSVGKGVGREWLSAADRRGHLIESAVGAWLLARSKEDHFDLYWWRERDDEVDFVVERGRERIAIEVKSGRINSRSGLSRFVVENKGTKALVVGSPDAPIEAFLRGEIPLFGRGGAD
jgi:predicted AAA+ superfamily ATPase